ncbi:T9SS type A sorting domain-containing protein [Saccharicrinis sp. GN24d3]|uniref:T9SS type A sorting domain-containing protein n=1 Tax=Saccharicrinis sp. GN24d3 TaxID=3458416 RepID=UPI0040371B51
MKTTFTLLLIFALTLSLSAKKHPFKSNLTQIKNTENPTLKAGHLEFQPSSIVNETWEDGSWGSPRTVSYQYDSRGNVTKITTPETQTTHAYDTDDNIIETILELYDSGSGSYINSTKTDFQFNDRDFNYETTYSTWVGNDWIVTGGNRTVREYDTMGNIASELYYYYQTSVGWIENGGEKWDRTYNGDLLTIEIYYNRTAGAWIEETKNEYFYDAQNRPNLAYEYEHDGNDFVFVGRYIDVVWFYWDNILGVDGSYPTSYTYQTYNGSGDVNDDNNYTNAEKQEGSYPDGHGNGLPPTIIDTYLIWENNSWVNTERETSIVNEGFNSYKEEEWDGSQWNETSYFETEITPTSVVTLSRLYVLGTLASVDRTTTTLNSFSHITETKIENQQGNNWIQTSGNQLDITYEGASAKMQVRITKNWTGSMYENMLKETFNYIPTSIAINNSGAASVYPTAFSAAINIETEENGFATFYNLTGSVALQKAIYAGENSISTAELSTGYYILKVNGEVFKVVKK